ncbi:hypothetical protein E1A91_A01G047000v1 [Gossypium mustelinum]|uniref:DNA/RNA-binding protein Alba-like domain-containing protein n=1 Tax=Gossypium mustelinum TaxID=34275 RepID=A0A5D3ABC5_GOSMU|nr:hypothetical protein E1A91_A01G047000v1 [Gossypium mustelinum]
MDRYQRVEKPKAETPIDEKEIRISNQGSMRNYISYALTLLQENGSNQIVFKAMGKAINKAVAIVELIKKRIVGLHQITSIGSTDIIDIPLGMCPSIITITLSKIELDMSSVGYQPPLPANQVKAGSHNDRDGRRMPRSRGNAEYDDGGRNHNRGYDRGRGRGSRGSGRGGCNGQQADRMEDGGYNYEAPPHGGRGKGYRGRGHGVTSNRPIQAAA